MQPEQSETNEVGAPTHYDAAGFCARLFRPNEQKSIRASFSI
jgi:hypothetical protein